MDWLGFAGSVLGGILSGVFTFIGVKATIKHENKKKEREKLEKAKENRPRLFIKQFFDFATTNNNETTNADGNVLLLKIKKFYLDGSRARFDYNDKALDDKNLEYVEYKLQNTGETEIDDIYITTNLPKDVSVFEMDNKDFFIKEHLLNYDARLNIRFLKAKKEFTLRIYYIKNEVIVSNLGNPTLTIWMRDINGRMWRQSLHAPYNTIDNSYLTTLKDFRSAVDIVTAIKCFQNPMEW